MFQLNNKQPNPLQKYIHDLNHVSWIFNFQIPYYKTDPTEFVSRKVSFGIVCISILFIVAIYFGNLQFHC